MHSAEPDARIRRARTRRINRVIDEALQSANREALLALMAVAAEEAAIIAVRNRRILEVYAHRSPGGWYSAWCDGSSITDTSGKRSGMGLVLMDPQHEVIAAVGEPVGALSPRTAELAK